MNLAKLQTLQQLKQQINQLPINERLALIQSLLASIEAETQPTQDIKAAIERMRGIAKTDAPAPTDAEVEQMLEEHRVEK